MEQLEEKFLSLAKKGIVLSVEDLEKICKNENLGVFTRASLCQMRYRWKFTAMHSRWTKPSHYMAASVEKLGNIFIDMAEFKPNLAVANKQIKYFLVAIDSLSQLAAVVPCVNKKQSTWETAINSMIVEKCFPYMHCFFTDRDVAVTGAAFQSKVKEKYGVNWHFLPSRSKSFAAERFIRFMKDRLAIALAANAKGDNRWIDAIPVITAYYNDAFVTGTKIRRRDVTKENYLDLLEEKWGVKDATLLMNSRVAKSFSPALYKKLFKFSPGEKVLLSRSANYLTKAKEGAFFKKSVHGSYGSQVFEIIEGVLKSSSKFFYTPCYRLSNLQGLFYETELIPALFQEPSNLKRMASNIKTNSGDEEEPLSKAVAINSNASTPRLTRAAAKRTLT